jgi:hypothetical protein
MVFAVIFWLPVWALAVSLRRTANPARSVLLATLMGAMLVLAMHTGMEDPTLWWQSFLQEMVEESMVRLDADQQAQLSAGLAAMAQMMTGIMGATLSVSLLCCLFLGRWWQSLLYNPGGFGEEFRQLRLGKGVAFAALLLVAAQLLNEVPAVLQDLLAVAMVAFAVQGLAMAHGLVKDSGAHRGWLIGLYLLLVLATAQAMVVLAFVGTVDNWFDFRTFFSRPKGGAGDA